MGITVRWDDPTTKNILFYEFASPWTWEEYQQAILTTKTMLDDADFPQPVNLVFYSVTEQVIIPPNPLPHLQRFLKMSLPPIDYFIVVDAPVMLRSLLNAMRLIYDEKGYLRRLALVDTLEEARAIVESQ